MTMTAVFLFALVASLGLLALHLASVLLAATRLARPAPLPPLPHPAPAVVLLRPVRGLDAFDLETLESSFGLDWPGYQVIFCAADADDPAVPAIRAMIARHPGVAARLMIGDDRETGNPKLDNLLKAWRADATEHVVIADANLLLPRDYLRRVMARFAPGVAMVSSPAIGVRADGFWAEVEAAILNGNQARWQLAADVAGQGYTQGKTMAFRRSWLEAAGGLHALAREKAEDAAATRLVRGMGMQVRLTDQPFAQPIGRRSAAAVWARQARWALLRRDAFPGLYAAEILNGPLVAFVLAAVAGFGLPGLGWLGLAVPVVWYGAEAGLAALAGWSRHPQALAAWLVRDLWLPALWLVGWRERRIEWRGNTVTAGQVAPPAPAPATVSA